jgi:hypothetical protein
MAKSKLRQLVGLPWAADSCPWVGKLRTVLPLNDRVIRDSAVPLWLTHQRGASGVVQGRASCVGCSPARERVVRVWGVGWTSPGSRFVYLVRARR